MYIRDTEAKVEVKAQYNGIRDLVFTGNMGGLLPAIWLLDSEILVEEKISEEEEEIDIDSIEELRLEKDYNLSSLDRELENKINEILKALKQTNRKIKGE